MITNYYNPKYDYTRMLPEHITALHNFRDFQLTDSPCIGLLKRGLIRYIVDSVTGWEYNKLVLTSRGRLARAGFFIGSRILIKSHHINFLIGQRGTVISVKEFPSSIDGVDEYGYVIKRSIETFSVDIKIDNLQGTWCFYSIDGLSVEYIPTDYHLYPEEMSLV